MGRNANKNKGDAFEREAVAVLLEIAPEHMLKSGVRMRELGAGRKEDMGDVRILRDTVVQVKAWKNVTSGIRQGSDGAERQRLNAGALWGAAMVPLPNSRKVLDDGVTVRWLAASYEWPDPNVGNRSTTETFTTAKFTAALDWLKDKKNDVPRELRVVELTHGRLGTLWIAPVQCWLRDLEAFMD
jgi:hypothetical protein